MTNTTEPTVSTRGLRRLTTICRLLLGTVWVLEGLLPKLFRQGAAEIALVRRSGLFLGPPGGTLFLLGIVEILGGAILISGWREKLAAQVATFATLAFTILVLINEPAALLDPFGGIVKNAALIGLGLAIWKLNEMISPPGRASERKEG
jgi:uncharacterized membrane protein YphA (DoxX/SURF4 family)